MKIGYIGQGMVGKAYADLFEKRGMDVVRYDKREPYAANKDLIKDCDIVFVSVPTPTTPNGFDDHIVREVMPLVGKGRIAVIRSTMLPGTTESIQEQFPDLYVMHAPEFLTARVAAEDAAHPRKNIIGIPVDSQEYREKAEQVLSILPVAVHNSICSAKEAEMIKYLQNNFFYVKNIYMSIGYKLAEKLGCDLDVIYTALLSEPMMGTYHHLAPVFDGGYGAAGECLLKDFEAFLQFYISQNGEESGRKVLEAVRDRNLELLEKGGKDVVIRESIYGAKGKPAS